MTTKLTRRSYWFPILTLVFVVLCSASTPAIGGKPWDWESPQAPDGRGWTSLGMPHEWESSHATTLASQRTRDGNPWDWDRPMSWDGKPEEWEGPQSWDGEPNHWDRKPTDWTTREGEPWDWERPMSWDAKPHDWEGPAASANRRVTSFLLAFLRVVIALR